MMPLHKITTLLLLTFSCADGLYDNLEVVMRGGDLIEQIAYDFPTYHNGACTVKFPQDGNWATQNGFLTGGWDANQNSLCQPIGPPAASYRLQRDGNFVAYCGTELDYTTHTGQGLGPGDYFLAIDKACVLHLFKGTFECDGFHIDEEIWTNIQDEPLRNGGRLGKGEQVRHASTTLVMQSSDGNLVLYDGIGSIDNPLWAASDTWDDPPGAMYHDFYAKVTQDGVLQLVGIENGNEAIYFEKLLGVPSQSDCFTIEYDAGEDDLVSVAAPCS